MQKRVDLVDIVKSFSKFKRVFFIYLQNSVSIQPRTGLSKFANNCPTVTKRVRTKIGPDRRGVSRRRSRPARRCSLKVAVAEGAVGGGGRAAA